MADNSYDLAPQEDPGKKPARNADANRPAPNPRRVPDAPAELQQERICPHCGFKMFGKLKARCPDCAAPMDHEATDILQFSPTSWLRSVSIGYVLVLLALLAHIVAISFRWNMDAGPFRVTLHQGAALFMVIGVFISTRVEPMRASTSPLVLIARFTAVGSLIFWVPLTLLAWRVYSFHYEMILFSMCVLACQGTLAIALGFYTSSLAARVPDDSLATQATNAGWAVGAACFIMAALHFLGMTGALIFIFCSFPLIGMLLCIFLWAATIPIRTFIALRNAATAADTIAMRRAQRDAAEAAKKKK